MRIKPAMANQPIGLINRLKSSWNIYRSYRQGVFGNAEKDIQAHKESKKGEISQKIEDLPEAKIADLFSPLGHMERIKILKSLMTGGKYFTELMNETGLSHSPVYFHLNVLQKASYVNQEFARGRYLITAVGEEAMSFAVRLYGISKVE